MPEWLKDPGVIAGCLALVGVVSMPFINARVKRKENGRIAAASAAQVAESLRVEVSERRLKEFMDRQAEEIVDLNRQLREERTEREALGDQVQLLERQQLRTAHKYDRLVAALLDEARLVRDQIREREDHDDVLPNIEKLVKALRDARGEFFNGEKSA